MPYCFVCRTAGTPGPRFRDTGFLGGTRQPLGELLERPEVVRLGVRLDRPVCFEYIGQATDIHGLDTFGVQLVQQVTTQCFLGVVTATSPFPIQSPAHYCIGLLQVWTVTGRFLASCRGITGQLAAFAQILLAGCRGTGDEIVRTNVRSGRLVGQWSLPCIIRNTGCETGKLLSVSSPVPRQPALFFVGRPVWVTDDFQSETALRAVMLGVVLRQPSQDGSGRPIRRCLRSFARHL